MIEVERDKTKKRGKTSLSKTERNKSLFLNAKQISEVLYEAKTKASNNRAIVCRVLIQKKT